MPSSLRPPYRVKNLSAFSLLLYVGVSEDLVGGETTFFKDNLRCLTRRPREVFDDTSVGIPPPRQTQLVALTRVAPKLGSALVFPHWSFPGSYPNPFHEGTKLLAGEKVLLRLDVHYGRCSGGV